MDGGWNSGKQDSGWQDGGGWNSGKQDSGWHSDAGWSSGWNQDSGWQDGSDGWQNTASTGGWSWQNQNTASTPHGGRNGPWVCLRPGDAMTHSDPTALRTLVLPLGFVILKGTIYTLTNNSKINPASYMLILAAESLETYGKWETPRIRVLRDLWTWRLTIHKGP